MLIPEFAGFGMFSGKDKLVATGTLTVWLATAVVLAAVLVTPAVVLAVPALMRAVPEGLTTWFVIVMALLVATDDMLFIGGGTNTVLT